MRTGVRAIEHTARRRVRHEDVDAGGDSAPHLARALGRRVEREVEERGRVRRTEYCDSADRARAVLEVPYLRIARDERLNVFDCGGAAEAAAVPRAEPIELRSVEREIGVPGDDDVGGRAVAVHPLHEAADLVRVPEVGEVAREDHDIARADVVLGNAADLPVRVGEAHQTRRVRWLRRLRLDDNRSLHSKNKSLEHQRPFTD